MSDMSERAKANILNMNEAVREDAEVAEDDCAISSSSSSFLYALLNLLAANINATASLL